VQKRPCSVSIGGCVEASTQFWRFNAAAHYNGAHPALRVTADIIRAEPAKAIALGESLDSHQHVRGLIINIASEHSSVVAALKAKEAAEMAGTSASGSHVPRWTRASFVFVSVFLSRQYRLTSYSTLLTSERVMK